MKRFLSGSQTGKSDEKLEKAGAEVCVIMENSVEKRMKVGTAEQKGFLKGEETSVVCFTRLKGEQKESVASQPSLQQVACRLHPHQSSGESQ